MKKLSFFILTIVILSCRGYIEGDNVKEVDFSFTIDTAFIDAGDQLIFHQIGLSHSDLSNDEKLLYNFTPKSELEVIDLDSLKLLEKIATNKEGPLGTGWKFGFL